MKVLFVNPPNKPFTARSLLIEPIDTLVLASYIESLGHEVSLLDMDVKQITPERIESYIKKSCPEVVIIVFDYHIPLHTTQCLEGVLEIAMNAKKCGAKVVVGGKLASYLPEKLTENRLDVDVLVAHDMELALKELLSLEQWNETELTKIEGISFRVENKYVKNKNRLQKIDLNKLPITNRELVDLQDYIDVRTILSSRGCFMKCSFCHVPGFWGNWRSQNPELVVNEIESLVQKHHAKKILFLDDNATVDKQRMRTICKLLIDKKIETTLGCLSTIISFDEETMRLMYEAGFRWIHYGVESGDDRILKNIKKLTISKQIHEVVSNTKKLGFRVRTSWILDLPEMDEEALENTINLILTLKTDEIRLHFLSVRLGSQYYDMYGGEDYTQQYIHNGRPNVTVSGVPADYLKVRVDDLLSRLRGLNYTIVRDAEEFQNLDAIRKNNPEMKIVSLCPLRYGIEWK